MKIIRPFAALAFVAALALTVGACGSSGRRLPGGDPFAADAETAAEIRIRVRNSNFYDATLTAFGDMGQRRLGTVGGNQTAVFTTPWTFTGGLRIQVDLLAGPTCTTDVITVGPGDTVDFEILPDFTRSQNCR
ncbi:MAG: hypothetical protein ABL963_01945 [Longimicrobiales bacterium]